MKTINASTLKVRFSDVLAEIRKGNKVALVYGHNKELLGVITPISKRNKRS